MDWNEIMCKCSSANDGKRDQPVSTRDGMDFFAKLAAPKPKGKVLNSAFSRGKPDPQGALARAMISESDGRQPNGNRKSADKRHVVSKEK